MLSEHTKSYLQFYHLFIMTINLLFIYVFILKSETLYELKNEGQSICWIGCDDLSAASYHATSC